ncbi:MAG: PKD domain-containing protein [Bacteroidota bacterium]
MRLLLVLCGLFYTSTAFPQFNFGLFGAIQDEFFRLDISNSPTTLDRETRLTVFEHTRIRSLAYVPTECRYYGIASHTEDPVLFWLDPDGNYAVVNQFTLDGVALPLVESMAWNELTGQLYVAVSRNGGVDRRDFYSETLVTVDLTTAACTLVGIVDEGDMDAMEFNRDKLIFVNTDGEETFIGQIPISPSSSGLLASEALLRVNRSITIIDMAGTGEQHQIFCTTGRQIYRLNLASDQPVLSSVGATHRAGEYDGFRMLALAYGPILEADIGFDLEVSGAVVSGFPKAGCGVLREYWWDFGDGTTATVCKPRHTYPQPGTYPVCLTLTSNRTCAKTFCDTIDIRTVGSANPVAPLTSALSLRAYPNPSSARFTLELDCGEGGVIETIEVYDSRRGLVANLRPVQPGPIIDLDLGSLAAGYYSAVVNGQYLVRLLLLRQ